MRLPSALRGIWKNMALYNFSMVFNPFFDLFTGGKRRPVFFGDEVTDDSVFAIMPDLAGLSFSVGRKARRVAGQFGRPRDVRRWLTELAGRAEAPTP